jgi:hypothetical protein
MNSAAVKEISGDGGLAIDRFLNRIASAQSLKLTRLALEDHSCVDFALVAFVSVGTIFVRFWPDVSQAGVPA